MTTAFWLLANVATAVVFGVLGLGVGVNWIATSAIKEGKLNWLGRIYRVELASQTQDVVASEIIDAVKGGMRSGKFDTEIWQINRRNDERRSVG